MDMDMEAIDLTPGTGKPHIVGRGDDAKARAMAVENGMKWKCSRVNAWVNLGDCTARYVQARDAQPSFHCVCLECASIDAHIRKHGITTPTQTAKQEQSPVATKPKAKPEQAPDQQSESNPFAGWERYRKEVRYNTGKDAYAAITNAHVLHFSAQAVVQHGLTRFKSVDVFASAGRLGLVFSKDGGGELKVTRKAKTETQGLHVSLRGVVKHYGLECAAGKRFQMIPRGEGVIEIELEKGTVAA